MLSGLWTLCNLWSINSSSQMKWLVVVSSVRQSHLPVLCKKPSRDQLEEGPWISPEWEHLHMGDSLIWLHHQREKNQASGENSQKFSFDRRYLRFPKSSLFSCLVLCSLAYIYVALKKSPFILRPSSLVPRPYQNCFSDPTIVPSKNKNKD